MTPSPKPPRAAVRPHPVTAGGHTRQDPYYWLRHKSDPAVIAYLEAENAYTAAVMAHATSLQARLYDEMVGRIQETDETAPVPHGPFIYTTRTEAGRQYDIYCRRRRAPGAVEEILLDLNRLAQESETGYLKLGLFQVSPDHNWLAYSLDTDGAEDFVVYFQDLQTGAVLPERLPRTAFTAAWANDNRTFFYTVRDDARRSAYLYRHVLGTDPAQDALVYHEDDRLFSVQIGRTRDQRFLLLTLGSLETTEVRFLAADQPAGDFQSVTPRQPGLRYRVDHRDGLFYIVTNADGAPNGRVVTTPVTAPGRDNWQDLIPPRPDVQIAEIDLFAHHLVAYQRENGLRTLRVTDLRTRDTHMVDFPEPVYTFRSQPNPEFDTPLLRFTYTSLTTPDTDVDYHMDRRQWTVVRRQPVLGGYDAADYVTERIWATADDGARVPISLVYRRGLARDGRHPCLLHGYGAYGASLDPSFRAEIVSLVDRGFVYALAHVRGGQEMGRHWYEQGKFRHKKNTFTDFIACARHLVAAGFTSRRRLAIFGRSAGGLLIGAVLNMAPDLCQTAVAGVPFVDVITTMLDESIPLTVGEFEEWGNPRQPAFYAYMRSYSPYDNVAAVDYPHLLVTAGLNDPRVAYWEPAKWVARLRAMGTGHRRLLLKTFMGAGHFSSSGRYHRLHDLAFEYAFILDTLGIHE